MFTCHYAPGKEPHWQIDGWDNFKAIFKAGSLKGGLGSVAHWLAGYDHDGDGAPGKAYTGGGTPNAFAKSYSPDALRAWTAISGSLPEAALNSSAAVGGIQLLERSPKIAAALLGFAFTNHLINLAYPIHAALMNGEKLAAAAKTGHDFATFATRIGKITGYASTTVARVTALAWASYLPLICACAVFSKYGHPMYCVSDQHAKRRLGKRDPTQYELDQEKLQIYHTWRKKRGSPRIYRALKWFSLSRFAIGSVAFWGGLISVSALPSLAPYAQKLKTVARSLAVVAIGAKGVRVLVDFQADEKVVSKRAKWISVCDVALTAGQAVSLFQKRTLPLAFVISNVKPYLIRELRMREERIAFAASAA